MKPEDKAFRKAVKYYRRKTLGLIPVTEIIPGMVEKKSLEYLKQDNPVRYKEILKWIKEDSESTRKVKA